MRRLILLFITIGPLLMGCGTARTTDTARTATEQLLISDAVDTTLKQMSFEQLAGYAVFLDTSRVDSVTDKDYLIGAVREKLASEGAALREDRSEADVIVELFVGALGTNKYEWFLGVPQFALPSSTLSSVPFLPELPLVKEIKQQGVAKIETFAYDAETGIFVAHSGSQRSGTNNRSVYLLGLGPFESGTVTDEIKLAGTPLPSLMGEGGEGFLPGLAALPEGWERHDIDRVRRTGAPRAEKPGSQSAQGKAAPTRRSALSRRKPKSYAPSSQPLIRLFFEEAPDKTVNR